MELEEWEVLSDDGFIDQDPGGRKIFPREKYSISTSSIVDMNYFHKLIEPPPQPQEDSIQISAVPVSISVAQDDDPEEEVVKEVTEEKFSISPTSPASPDGDAQRITAVPKVEEALDMETITHQVFFNKPKGTNQFVDMKLDSPKSVNRGILPQIDVGVHQFEAKVGDLDGDDKTLDTNEEVKEGVPCWEGERDVVGHDGTDKSNLWKFGMTGIGALFSFGFACATTVCIIALGGHQREKQHRQRVHFHVFADDKVKPDMTSYMMMMAAYELGINLQSINQVVRHANKLNEAISAMRSGAPVTRAQVTIGGYFEGL